MLKKVVKFAAVHCSRGQVAYKSNYEGLRRKLLMYDNGMFDEFTTKHKNPTIVEIKMKDVDELITELSAELIASGESITLFGKRHNNAIEGMVGAISQTFGGEPLYPTVEAQAAQLLYSVLKGHPFLDGNKRIAVSLFIKFLELNRYLTDDKGDLVLNGGHLLTIVINIAESKPEDQEKVIKNVMTMLVRESTD